MPPDMTAVLLPPAIGAVSYTHLRQCNLIHEVEMMTMIMITDVFISRLCLVKMASFVAFIDQILIPQHMTKERFSFAQLSNFFCLSRA